MPYKKYDPKVDVLKEGTKIRLAGREGVIDDVNGHRNPKGGYAYMHFIKWSDEFSDNATLEQFPDIEIFVQPLTIPRATKDQLYALASTVLGSTILNSAELANRDCVKLCDFINSLEVTND